MYSRRCFKFKRKNEKSSQLCKLNTHVPKRRISGEENVQWHISRDEYIPETSKNNTLIFSAINIHFKIKPFKINISITFYRHKILTFLHFIKILI